MIHLLSDLVRSLLNTLVITLTLFLKIYVVIPIQIKWTLLFIFIFLFLGFCLWTHELTDLRYRCVCGLKRLYKEQVLICPVCRRSMTPERVGCFLLKARLPFQLIAKPFIYLREVFVKVFEKVIK